jgi:hypothetical protein
LFMELPVPANHRRLMSRWRATSGDADYPIRRLERG